ncbi:MAG: endolytic transglycosylase MltG [Clostridiales bacterium]|nr:endolytic transglycosylase MltG [Clostridiales bacterium]
MSDKVRIALRILIVVILLFAFTIIGVYVGYNYVLSQEARFSTLSEGIEQGKFIINKDTPGAVPILLEAGDSTSDIADKLQEEGLIDNTLMFSLLSKINGFDGAYIEGTHYVTAGLTYDEIMYYLTLEPASVSVTIPEGISYEEIKEILHKAGLNFNDEEFDECMNSPNLFVDYDFISKIEIDPDRDYILAGYLFPDTYTFDVNASPESIIRKFLNNMNNKLFEEYYTRAERIGMSMDEVITLASVIQMESNNVRDMMYISAVFHNRLDAKSEDMQFLSSSATINYLIKKKGGKATIKHSSNDLEIVSPYNTYKNKGLPPGPVSMPGLDAISAALYPEPNCNYMFFCATGDGGTAFAVTLKEHEKNIAKYSGNWDREEAEATYDADKDLGDGDTDDDQDTTEPTTGGA